MVHIKRFIDKVSSLDNKSSRDMVMPASEARMLRDEIAKLLADVLAYTGNSKSTEPLEIHMAGGKW